MRGRTQRSTAYYTCAPHLRTALTHSILLHIIPVPEYLITFVHKTQKLLLKSNSVSTYIYLIRHPFPSPDQNAVKARSQKAIPSHIYISPLLQRLKSHRPPIYTSLNTKYCNNIGSKVQSFSSSQCLLPWF